LAKVFAVSRNYSRSKPIARMVYAQAEGFLLQVKYKKPQGKSDGVFDDATKITW
jgi:hypothetical protein